MAYDTFSWDRDTGAGYPSAFEPRRQNPILTNTDGAAYDAIRPRFSRGRWLFLVSFSIIRPQGFMYLVQWHHDHVGEAFYFQWPWQMFGTPDAFGEADPGGVSPWASEVTPGFGDPPTHLVYMPQDFLPLSKAKQVDCWMTTQPIEFQQV